TPSLHKKDVWCVAKEETCLEEIEGMEGLRYSSYGVGLNVGQNSVGRSRRRPSLDPSSCSPTKHRAFRSTKTSSSSKKWWNDPEMKRRRRVAKYKLYSAEGKIKISLKKGFHWLKKKCIVMVSRL
ncbi:hypothetical protein F2P56_019251, partial [Juglans regia]